MFAAGWGLYNCTHLQLQLMTDLFASQVAGTQTESDLSPVLQDDPAPDAVLTVQDDEVKVDKWVSPEKAQQQEAEQAAAGARSAAFQQGLALRRVRHMLGEGGHVQGSSQAQSQVMLPLSCQQSLRGQSLCVCHVSLPRAHALLSVCDGL